MILPQLTPNAVADSGVGALPPFRFRPLRGTPWNVSWSHSAPAAGRGRTEAQKSGLRYEEKAQKLLATRVASYLRSPRLDFVDLEGPRFVVPDGLYFAADGVAFIFEIKRQHMPEAWWQLRRLYEPVVQRLSFVNRTSCVEIVGSYDPAMGFPERVQLCGSVEEVLSAPCGPLKVLECRL